MKISIETDNFTNLDDILKQIMSQDITLFIKLEEDKYKDIKDKEDKLYQEYALEEQKIAEYYQAFLSEIIDDLDTIASISNKTLRLQKIYEIQNKIDSQL